MPTPTPELDTILLLDANAVAGTLEQIFGRDITASLISCNQCGNTAALGTLKAFTHAPGVVLRCSICEQVVLRFTTMLDGVYLDLRGMSCIRLGQET